MVPVCVTQKWFGSRVLQISHSANECCKNTLRAISALFAPGVAQCPAYLSEKLRNARIVRVLPHGPGTAKEPPCFHEWGEFGGNALLYK